MKALQISPGDTFGYLRVLEEAPRQRSRSGMSIRILKCECRCGTVKLFRLTCLRRGTTVSCGCYHRVAIAASGKASATTHGQSRTPLYLIWTAMKMRCHNPANKSYWRYGARGISVCQEWRDDFTAFAAYVGERPQGYTLDRINCAGNYEPGNVRWATYKEQARNTRRNIWVEAGGARMTLAEACETLGLPYERARLAIRAKGEFKGVRHVES